MATILIDTKVYTVDNEVANVLSTLKDELLAAKIMKEEYKAALRMADAEHNYTQARLAVYKLSSSLLQSLSLWGRIKHSITGLFKGY